MSLSRYIESEEEMGRHRGVPSRERPAVYTLRLAPSERALLEAAATSRAEYLAEFIRTTSLAAARVQLAQVDGHEARKS